MIKPAQLYIKELKEKFWETAYDPKYQYANDGYVDDYDPSDSTWNEHEFVSIDSKNNVLGYIRYSINQRSNKAYGFCAINFSNNKAVFGKDLLKVIDNIFVKYRINKLKYGVYIGNPIEKTYDKLTEKYGGRIVGISYMDVKLLTGEYTDNKTYELFREHYLMAKYSNKKRLKDVVNIEEVNINE